MGKLLKRLEQQLQTEHKNDASECLKIYAKLKEMEGGVWSTRWDLLTDVTFIKPNRIYKPSGIGRLFLKGME